LFAGFGFGFLHGFHDELEPMLPAHERLAVDVLVVFGKVESAAQAFVDGAAVVLGRQTEFGFDRAPSSGRPYLFKRSRSRAMPLGGPPHVLT